MYLTVYIALYLERVNLILHASLNIQGQLRNKCWMKRIFY